MTLPGLQQRLEERIRQGQIDEFFQDLKTYLQPECDSIKNSMFFEARYRRAQADFGSGQIDFGEKSREIAQLSPSLRELVRQIKPEELRQVDSQRGLNDHHKFTCNRRKQFIPLDDLLSVESEQREKRHFYYLYGGEAQSHEGFFQRFVHRLKEEHYDYLGPKVKPSFEVFSPQSISVSEDDLRNLGAPLRTKVLTTLGHPDAEHLPAALDRFSGAKNWKFCFHLSLSKSFWGKDSSNEGVFGIQRWFWKTKSSDDIDARIEVVRKAILSFIETFCLNGWTKDTPEFFFFFSAKYEADDTLIKERIKKALHAANYLKPLGELESVKDEHIDNWYEDYQAFWPGALARKKSKEDKFGQPMRDEFKYMDNVIPKLQEVINEINNHAAFNENRNS